MSLFDKTEEFKKLSYNKYSPNDFIDMIHEDDWEAEIYSELNLFMSNYYGVNFLDIWNHLLEDVSSDPDVELIELFKLIYNFSKSVSSNNNYLKNWLFRKGNQDMNVFINKTDFQIKISPYKEIKINFHGIETTRLIKDEIGEILEVIDDEKTNLIVHNIMNASNYEFAEKELFSLQKPMYEELKLLMKKSTDFNSLNLKSLNRKIQAFVRHDKEHNDKDLKDYYKSLSENYKLLELKKLTVEYLHFIYLVNLEGENNE